MSITFHSLQRSYCLIKMAGGHQRDHTKKKADWSRRRWKAVCALLSNRRGSECFSGTCSSLALISAKKSYHRLYLEYSRFLYEARFISFTNFPAAFHDMKNLACLELFRFKKIDIGRMFIAVGWPTCKFRTSRKRYRCDPLLVTCVILRFMSAPKRWVDIETLLVKKISCISELYWEGIEEFSSTRGVLLSG